jgi:GNAT superfamily N-acetyltransferase
VPEPAKEYDLPLYVRRVRKSDLGFIYATWMNNLREKSQYASERTCNKCGSKLRGIDKNWFFAAQHALITRLMSRSAVFVACSIHNDDQLYGYIVCEPLNDEPLLHWLFVKDSSARGVGPGYRRAGVAQRLMEAAFPRLGEQDIVATIRTPSASQLPARWQLSFNTHRLCERAHG